MKLTALITFAVDATNKVDAEKIIKDSLHNSDLELYDIQFDPPRPKKKKSKLLAYFNPYPGAFKYSLACKFRWIWRVIRFSLGYRKYEFELENGKSFEYMRHTVCKTVHARNYTAAYDKLHKVWGTNLEKIVVDGEDGFVICATHVEFVDVECPQPVDTPEDIHSWWYR